MAALEGGGFAVYDNMGSGFAAYHFLYGGTLVVPKCFDKSKFSRGFREGADQVLTV